MDQIIGANLETLLSLAEAMALKKADGHLTILRFTTHWKVILGTPDLITGDDKVVITGGLKHGGGYGQVLELEGYGTLEEALKNLILAEQENVKFKMPRGEKDEQD